MTTKPLARSISTANAAKQDEFYTQYVDIHSEVEADLEFDANTFKSRIAHCHGDEPSESNIFNYLAASLNKLGLKGLICPRYEDSRLALWNARISRKGRRRSSPKHSFSGNGHGLRKKSKSLARFSIT